MRLLMVTGVMAMTLAAPAGAQDVLYRFEQRIETPGQDTIFTVAAPASGALIEQRIGLLAVEPFEGGAPVPGAPYTADATTDVVQALVDGNRIEHHTTSQVARDGQGRTRREQQLAAIGPMLPKVDGQLVTIMDPVAGVHYSLDPARKVAIRAQLPGTGPRPPGAGTRDIEITTTSAIPAQRMVFQADQSQSRTEALGATQIEGVAAQGTRTIVTIPAGAVGNQSPIEIVSERWFSPELGVVVLSRRADPRFGETTYRLQNIVRAEPSPELFQVPADFTVESAPAFGAVGPLQMRRFEAQPVPPPAP